MKKLFIIGAAMAALSTFAFADDGGFNGSTLSKGSAVDNDTAKDSNDLYITKKNNAAPQAYVQSLGDTQDDGIGYLSKDPGVHDNLGAQ